MELNFVLKIELRFRNRASMSTSSSDFTIELRFRNTPSISRSMFDFRAKPRFRNKSWNQSSILNSKLDLETEARFWSQISIFNSKLDFDIRSSIVLEKYLLLKTVKIKIFFSLYINVMAHCYYQGWKISGLIQNSEFVS